MKTISIVLWVVLTSCASFQVVSAADTMTYKGRTLWSFGNGNDGESPVSSVIDIKGVLYGTTYAGGNYSGGTVYALDLSLGTEKVLYSFLDNSDANLIDLKGTLYGTTVGGDYGQGTVFSFDLNTSTEETVHSFMGNDGDYPNAGLVKSKEILYGTTLEGGSKGGGTVFSLDSRIGTEKVLYSFCSQANCTDGTLPGASPTEVNGVLYGTTERGGGTGCGGSGCGTVFSVTPKTGAETVLYSFCTQTNCADGAIPYSSLIDVNGMLYGTTAGGGVTGCGSFGCGTVFSIDLTSGAEKVIYSFCKQQNCTDGANPHAGLVDVNGTLYGTTVDGGGANGGTVFSVDPGTGAETVLYSFCIQKNCADGTYPYSSLTSVNGRFFGTTSFGGAYDSGTVFVLKPRS